MMVKTNSSAVSDLAAEYARRHPAAAASELEATPLDEAVELLARMPAATSAAVLQRVTPVAAQSLLERLPADSAANVLGQMQQERAAGLLARLDDEARAERLGRMPTALAREIREILSHPPETAGAVMNPRILTLAPDTRVATALEHLRSFAHRRALEMVVLIDDDQHLIGAVALQELAIADGGERMVDLPRLPAIAVSATSPRDEVIETLAARPAARVVVVDIEERVLGVIRRDALIEAAREEASVDAQKMVGASKDERALSPATFAVRKRLPWLVVNLGTAFLAAAVVGIFESTIAKVTALAVLLPVVAGQSGNTGAQALAVTMRGLALREVRTRHAPKVAFKELQAGFLNGVAVAAITAAAVLVWSHSAGLALVIGSSMVIAMTVAGLAGAAIPMVLTAVGQDPAQSSSIVLTTVTDVVGFMSFLGIATLFAAML